MRVWELSKKVDAQFAWTYYKPTKECGEDWVALEDCMNCIKILCRVNDKDGEEEIYLDFNKNFSKTSLSPMTSSLCCRQLL